jgi:hypothetical protein
MAHGDHPGFRYDPRNDHRGGGYHSAATRCVQRGSDTYPLRLGKPSRILARLHVGTSPGGAHTIFGFYLAASTQTASGYLLPTSLAGTSVLVNGFAAPLFFVSPSQIHFQMVSGNGEGTGLHRGDDDRGLKFRRHVVDLTGPTRLVRLSEPQSESLNQDCRSTYSRPRLELDSMSCCTDRPWRHRAGSAGRPASARKSASVCERNCAVDPRKTSSSARWARPPASPAYSSSMLDSVRALAGDQPVFVSVNGIPSNARFDHSEVKTRRPL